MYYRGWIDRGTERWIRGWLRPGDTYVDVGAHIGFYLSIAVEAIGQTGSVVAFEPTPETFEKLRQSVDGNLDLRQRSLLYPAAVGATRGTATIHRPVGGWSHQSARASLSAGGDGEFEPAARVDVLTLDEVLPYGTIRLLKIDVEGGELEVIRGAGSILSQRRADAILMELNPRALDRAGTSPSEVIDSLAVYGYVGRSIEEAGTELVDLRLRPARQEFVDAVFLPEP